LPQLARYGSGVIHEYLEAAEAAAALIAQPEVAASWHEPSALPEMTVGGLAVHLSRQITQAKDVLSQPSGHEDVELITVLDHYARAAWVAAGLDDEVNVSIRGSAEEEARGSPASLIGRTDAALRDLHTILTTEAADRPVYLPWTGWTLTLEDFLTTRTMEIVVHIDDLAVSLNVESPLPQRAIVPVLTLLTRLATRRHGPVAVLRALSRAERAPTTIAAF